MAIGLGILAIFPYTRNVAQPVKLLLVGLCGTAAVTVLFLKRFVNATPCSRWGWFSSIVVLYFAVQLLAAFMSPFPALSMASLQMLAVYTLLFFVAVDVIDRPEDLTPILVVACLAMGLSSLYAMAQKIGVDPFPWADRTAPEYLELPATFGNGNLAAHMIGPAIVIAIYLTRLPKLRGLLLLLPLYLLHLYWTKQRGAWVGLSAGLLLGIVFYLAQYRFNESRKRVAATLVVMMLVGGSLTLGIAALAWIATGTPVPLDHALMLRYSGFDGAAEMIREKPLLGWGPGNYPLFNPLFWTEYEQEYFAVRNSMNFHVHNEWLQAALDAGVAAAGLYLLLVISTVVVGLTLAAHDCDPARRRFGLMVAVLSCVVGVDGMTGFNLHVVPVGATVFVLIGALQSIVSGKVPCRSMVGSRVRWGIVATYATVLAVQISRMFVSEILLRDGIVSLEHKNVALADGLLSRGERLAPWNAEFAYFRGHTALTVENPDAAIPHFERALSRNPTHIPAMAGLGHAHVMRIQQRPQSIEFELVLENDLREIREWGTRILDLCSLHSTGAALRATAALWETELSTCRDDRERVAALLEQAHQDMLTALHFAPGRTAPNYVTFALIELKRGEPNKAQQALRNALRLEPDNRDALHAFESFAYAENRIRVFETTLEQVQKNLEEDGKAESASTRARFLAARARVATRMHKDLDQAENLYRQAIALAPTEPEVLASFGEFARAHQRLAVFDESLRSAGRTLENEWEQRVIEAVVTGLRGDRDSFTQAAESLENVLTERQQAFVYRGTRLPLLAWAAQFLVTEYEARKADVVLSGETLMRFAVVLAESGDTANALCLVDSALPRLTDSEKGRGFYIRKQILDRINRTGE